MIGWIDKPPHHPHRCALTLQSTAPDGPYYATGLSFFSAHSGPHGPVPGRAPEQLYLSPQAFREALGADGSPLVAIPTDDLIAERLESQRVLLERDDLALQLEEATARIAELEANLDPDRVADAVVTRLDERYARRTGPKPRAKSVPEPAA